MARVNIIEWIAKKLRSLTGIVEDGDTAIHAISAGKYVIWKGNPCKASSAISIGDALSSSNLTALTDGVCNDLADETGAKVNKTDIVNNLTTNDSTKVLSAAQGYALNSNKANAIVNAHSTLGTDLNTYTTTGMYGIEGATNCPTGYAYGTLIVTRYSSSAYVTQTWQSVIEEKFFIRHSFNGTWQPWEELALNSKITEHDVTDTTSAAGYLITTIPATTKVLTAYTKAGGYSVIPFQYNSVWYFAVCYSDGTKLIPLVSSSVTIYYLTW